MWSYKDLFTHFKTILIKTKPHTKVPIRYGNVHLTQLRLMGTVSSKLTDFKIIQKYRN